MSILIERPLAVRSDGLLLEARLHEAEPAAFAAVVLHPHPQYGGDMDNHVVATLCETLAASPATTLRVNFRGAGRSEGAFDGGRGEVNDARAAVVALRSAAPGLPLVLIGYSFGAMIAAALLADSSAPPVDALILVSPPIANSALPGATHQLPTLVLTGDQDAISPAAAVSALATPARRTVVIPGVAHNWYPGIERLTAEVAASIDSLGFTRRG